MPAATVVLGVIAALPEAGDPQVADERAPDRRAHLAAVGEIAVVAICLTAVTVWAFRHEGGEMSRRLPAHHSARAADQHLHQ